MILLYIIQIILGVLSIYALILEAFQIAVLCMFLIFALNMFFDM